MSYLSLFYFMGTNCFGFRARAFKFETERLVNELKNSAQYAEGKLEIIEDKA